MLALDPPLKAGKDMIRRVKDSTVYVRCEFGSNSVGTGSGFFAGKSGYVVTNSHVVGYVPDEHYEKPTRIKVIVNSGEVNQKEYVANIVGLDAHDNIDLALLKLPDSPDYPPLLPIGKSASLSETEEVYIFGYPLGEKLGLNVSVNKTTVSSLRKEKGNIDMVQIAGGMHSGNSGGPVVNGSGQLIGVSVAGIPGAPIDFAIPAEKVSDFLREQFATGGKMELAGLQPKPSSPFGPGFGPRSPGRPGIGGMPGIGPPAIIIIAPGFEPPTRPGTNPAQGFPSGSGTAKGKKKSSSPQQN